MTLKKQKTGTPQVHRNTRQTGQYYNTYLLRIDIAQGFPAIINAQQRFSAEQNRKQIRN